MSALKKLVKALLFPSSSYSGLLFICILIGIMIFYGYHQVLPLEPQSMHSWRQADCTSIAYGFIEENNPFKPQMHYQIGDNFTSGKTAGEFPGLYYVVGKLWAMFGHHAWIFRLVVILLFAGSILRLQKSLKRHVDQFWSFIVPLFIFTSPLLVFYGNNFLSNVPSLSCAIFGFAYYLDYREKKCLKKWVLFALFFALAALLKVTGYVGFIAIMGTEVLLRLFKVKERLTWRELLVSAVSILMVLGWYKYASYYNDLHGGKYTFNDIWPLWRMSAEEVDRAVTFFNEITFYQLLSIPGYAVLVGFVGFLIMRIRKVPIDFLLISSFLLVGFTIYILLWFNAVEQHDYYFINVMFLPLALAVSFVYTLKNSNKAFASKLIRTGALLLTLMSIVYTSNNFRMKYQDQIYLDENLTSMITTERESGYWHWIAHDNYMDVHFEMDSVLNSYGITRDVKVISLPDPSFNISLYTMNRKGWTSYGYHMERPEALEEKIEKGAQYLIYAHGKDPDLTPIEEYLTDTLAVYKNVVIFNLKSKAEH